MLLDVHQNLVDIQQKFYRTSFRPDDLGHFHFGVLAASDFFYLMYPSNPQCITLPHKKLSQINGLLGIDTLLLRTYFASSLHPKKIRSKLLSNISFVKQIFQGKLLIVNRNSLWKSEFFCFLKAIVFQGLFTMQKIKTFCSFMFYTVCEKRLLHMPLKAYESTILDVKS